MRSLGIDIGSTTAKVVLTEGGEMLFSRYVRHLSRSRQTALELLREALAEFGDCVLTAAVSGSAGMGLAEAAGLEFVQEVFATGEAVKLLAPDAGAVIELGGEDAKVIFFSGGVDERMNGSCAGGTGAFIDQMAVLLNMSVEEMDRESLTAEQIYPIASRCGVFAKSDIQPLLNQGARKADIAASIYQAVVNQTVVGLIQGRRLEGKILFLGGPLHYCEGLRRRFRETLALTDETAVFPPDGRFSVAIGAAAFAARRGHPTSLSAVIAALEREDGASERGALRLPPLFENEEELARFRARHAQADLPVRPIADYAGGARLGIDCGSTTTKLVLIDDDDNILYSSYGPNRGDPVSLIRDRLREIYSLCGSAVTIRGSAVTGYGEDLIRCAFGVDEGVVETVAHYTAAKHFCPDVDFILDIGGQDIKCFRIRGGAIDSILLNEACSSGCGSFVETFARSMGYDVAAFAELGLLARAPVDLGSRCTVFMNSAVKQSQKDGASVADISAGLSVSVVKNAVYKVIRAASAAELGSRIVVQGGTFLNDAVLRAFERELGAEVIRPGISGLMGAYGAALRCGKRTQSTLISPEALDGFTHESSPAVCGLCANRCHLTVNRFPGGRRFISGNRCQRALGVSEPKQLPNLFEWKRDYFSALTPVPGPRGAIGLPMALGMLEFAPLWHGFFTALGFEARFSGLSTRATYERGQRTIPSDTACYPAKIMHGHVLELLDAGITTIFYPGVTYNVDEHAASNHYNCPVVAYYSELLHGNMEALRAPGVNFLYPYLSLDSEKMLAKTILPCLRSLDPSITKADALRAAKAGFSAYHAYRNALRAAGDAAVQTARELGCRVMILAGRPYHIDPEISHGIDRLANELGFAVVTEDSVCERAPVQYVKVLDQWTFHARLYRAADYAVHHADTELVQLVSFGCGIDAITTDEVREILERGGKHYTQIKIDEITNLGAVKIRLRSLLGALEDAEERGAGHAG